jgi:hypothetical protein
MSPRPICRVTQVSPSSRSGTPLSPRGRRRSTAREWQAREIDLPRVETDSAAHKGPAIGERHCRPALRQPHTEEMPPRSFGRGSSQQQLNACITMNATRNDVRSAAALVGLSVSGLCWVITHLCLFRDKGCGHARRVRIRIARRLTTGPESAPSERIIARTSAAKARISVWVGPLLRRAVQRSVTSFLPEPLSSRWRFAASIR